MAGEAIVPRVALLEAYFIWITPGEIARPARNWPMVSWGMGTRHC
jgi:hypothetical protein